MAASPALKALAADFRGLFWQPPLSRRGRYVSFFGWVGVGVGGGGSGGREAVVVWGGRVSDVRF